MPIEIRMPALSPTMKEGTLSRWLKKEGDGVKPGDIIAEIETDKATMEVESVEEGIIGKILVEAGALNVAVNKVIALLLEEGEEISALEGYVDISLGEKNSFSALEITHKKDDVTPSSCSIPSTSSARIIASPLAKRVAAKENVDLQNIKGTGPHGRIVHEDVMAALKNPSTYIKNTHIIGRNSVEFSAIPNSSMRKIIARRLLESKTTIPHFYLSVECVMDALLDMRNVINNDFALKAAKENGNAPLKISVNDCVIKAVALALRDIPTANASWTEEAILQFNNVDVAVAVAIDGGLITPIIKNADQKSLAAISKEMKELIGKAKSNSLKPEEFQGGGFCISNLGMYNVDYFSAIINPPQSCILAVGASREKAFVKDKNIVIGTCMTVTLSCDHRVVDGAVGAEFLARFKHYVESPVLMFM